MESLVWGIRTHEAFTFAWPIFLNLVICLVIAQGDFPLLIAARLLRSSFFRKDSFYRRPSGERPTGLVIIPSLLRDDGDFNAITTTLESCGANGYPSELHIIASVDGRTENPKLYAELEAWVRRQRHPKNVHVLVTGTETRLGKMMAVEAGVAFMKDLVSSGHVAAFPEVYFSIDGDGTLGDDALERLAHRLTTPHVITGNMRRVVSGKICIRPDLFWRGWRALFTVEGQIYMQVAREFMVSNVSRFNWKPTPMIGIPGALYCTWGELIEMAPRYMGFMQGLTFKDCVDWWMGRGAPKFSEQSPPSMPEALTGASDDTCIAFIASLASWRDGKLSFDAPASPLHAFGRLFRSFIYERSHDYEPEARVYTYTPSTLKGLWKQRVRWNASRFECAGRFWRAFWFHWEIGFPVGAQLATVLRNVLEMTAYYVILPYYCMGSSNGLLNYLVGYAGQTIAYTLYSLSALMLEREYRKFWRVLLCLPVASLYTIGINFFGCVYGVSRDLLFFGNATNFAPEWTLEKGGCVRVALLFRVRRFLALALRSVVYGDVPLGTFWVGWSETTWTPSGFVGWTTGKKPRAIFVWPWARARVSERKPLLAIAPALSAVVEKVDAEDKVHVSEPIRVSRRPSRLHSQPSMAPASAEKNGRDQQAA
jgi:cellulose synthase/poly-beta-1,6-N-acetylglucosamine synthase-like glycosyltransferase